MRVAKTENARAGCAAVVDWREWRDRFNAADPGLNQLRKAARATVASIVATWLLFRLIHWMHEPKAVAFIGIFISILGVMLVNDPTPQEQRTTTLLVPLPAMVSVTLGTFVAPVWWLNNIVFVVIIFGAVFVQQFGPRYLALGFIGFVAYFDALFFRAKVAETPWLLIGILIGAALAYAMRFWIWPDRPQRILRLTALAYRGQLRRVCKELARRALVDHWGRREDNRLTKMTVKLNEVALALEKSAGAGSSDELEVSPDLRQWILETELAVESMAESVRRLVRSEPLAPRLKLQMHEALCRVREALRERQGRLPAAALRECVLGRGDTVANGTKPDSIALQHFNEALRDFADVLERKVRPELDADFVRMIQREEPEKPDNSVQRQGRRFDFRQTIQATIAAVAAMAAGEMISRQRWYWSVLAAFVVFTRTSTSSETLVKGWQRVLGTIVGVTVGLGIGEAVIGHEWLQIILIYASIFLAYFFLRISYAWTMVWFTLLLSVLYSLLGLLTPGLLGLRLLLTVVGAAVGVLCARFVFPFHTGEKVREAAIAVLDSCRAFLQKGLEENSTDGVTVEQARQLDERLQELRQAAMPLEQRFLPVEGREQRQLVEAATDVAFFTRQLARASHRRVFVARELAAPARGLAENISVLIEALNRSECAPVHSVVSSLDTQWRRAPSADDEACRLIHWLRRIDQEILRIACFTAHHSGDDGGLCRPRITVAMTAAYAGLSWRPLGMRSRSKT